MLKKISGIFILCATSQIVHAAHPLITEDTGTQDVGNRQFEINTDWSKQHSTRERVAAMSFAYGTLKNLDLFINAPYTLFSPSGLNDISVGVKWRFFENGPLSFVFKPELTLTTGDENKGLGKGKTNSILTFVSSYEAAPWSFHGNVAVAMNRFKLQSDKDTFNTTVWRASAAAMYSINDQWKIVADAGLSRSDVKDNRLKPAHALTGLIYSPHKNLDVDTGVKFGLNKAEVDHQIGIGFTWRF